MPTDSGGDGPYGRQGGAAADRITACRQWGNWCALMIFSGSQVPYLQLLRELISQ